MYGADTMPQTAENVANVINISREEQDQFALKVNKRRKKQWKKIVLQKKLFLLIYQDQKRK